MRVRLPQTSVRWNHRGLRRYPVLLLLVAGFLWFSSPNYHHVDLPPSPTSQIHFILFLGIEGTGHHFWQDLFWASPMYQRLVDLELAPVYSKSLTTSLYRHKKARWKGLWSAVCQWKPDDPKSNTTAIEDNLVTLLQEIQTRVVSETPVYFPINLQKSGNEFGVMSYPGFLKPCRGLQYPNLEVWYQACDRAGVICEHVYISRDPYAVIQSTTHNRPINKATLEAIHLYTTQLHILHTQLLSTSSRLMGCWNYEEVVSSSTYDEKLLPIYGVENDQSFREVVRKVYNKPSVPSLTASDKQRIVPVELEDYMQSMVKMHNVVVQTCHELWKAHETTTG